MDLYNSHARYNDASIQQIEKAIKDAFNVENKYLHEGLKKKINEDFDVNHPIGVLPHADAVAMEQHIADRAAGLERRANPDKDPLVKELIEETASEKSRTLHYDVVDRKGLAKILTEAKKNKCDFKVGRSDKAGYRYFVDILPIYGSKGALGVDDGSTEVDGETLAESLLKEDIEKELKDYIKWCEDNKKEAKDAKSLKQYVDQLKNPGKSLTEASTAEKRSFKQGGEATGDLIQGKAIGRIKDPKARQAAVAAVRAGRPDVAKQFYGDRKEDQAFAANDKKMAKMQRYLDTEDDVLEEDLEVYTSSLEDFKPAKEAQELWDEIIKKGKLDDLEYELENVFKSDDDENASIDIEGLNDLLVNHPDFIRTLIGLDDAPLEDDDYDDDDVEPVDNDDLIIDDDDDDEEPVEDEAPVESEDDEDVIDYKTDKIDSDDEDDIEPLTDAELADDVEEYPEAPRYVDEEPEEKKKPSEGTKKEDNVEEALTGKEERQKKIDALRAKLNEDCECEEHCGKEPELKLEDLEDEEDDLEDLEDD